MRVDTQTFGTHVIMYRLMLERYRAERIPNGNF